MRREALLLLSAVCLTSLLCQVEPAFAGSEALLAVVDMQRALSSSMPGAEAQKKYEKEAREAQSEIDGKKKEFEKLKENFTKQRESLNAKARAEKEEELLGLKKEIEREFEDATQTLRRKNTQIVSDLVGKLKKIVAEVGREKGYTMVFEKESSFVLYADDAADITEEVIRRFNRSVD